MDFFDNVEDQYGDYFADRILDCSNIEQQTRANSCLKSYHDHLQKIIPRKQHGMSLSFTYSQLIVPEEILDLFNCCTNMDDPNQLSEVRYEL